MPAKYCSISSCGGKTEYTVKPPKFCSVCRVEFAKAFMVVAQPVETKAAVIQPTVTKRVVNKRPSNQEVEEGDEFYDPNEVQEQAREIVASISAADFGIVLTPIKDGAVTLGSLLKNPEAYNVGTRTSETQLSAE